MKINLLWQNEEYRVFDSDFNHICILDDRTVLVKAMDDVKIDLEKASYAS